MFQVVHNNLSPSNILIANGRALFIDFETSLPNQRALSTDLEVSLPSTDSDTSRRDRVKLRVMLHPGDDDSEYQPDLNMSESPSD